MDRFGDKLDPTCERILNELSESLVPRLFRIAAHANVLFHPRSFQEKGLSFSIQVSDAAWRLYLLLSDTSRKLVDSLGPSLRQLTHTTVYQSTEDCTGTIRGHLDAFRTVLVRAQRGGNRLLLALDEPMPTSNVPENRLLKATLLRMSSDIEVLAHSRRQSELGNRFRAMEAALHAALRHPYLDSLTAPSGVTGQMLQAACRSKIPAHHFAYRFWVQDLRHRSGDQQTLLDVLSTVFVFPENRDHLFEFYTLMNVILALKEAYPWRAVCVGLPGEHAISRFESDDLVCNVYSNLSPSEALTWASDYRWKYNDVFEAYTGISVRTRRPDIIIELLSPPRKPLVLLVETKFTGQQEYIRDSVYKTLGYLADFDPLWDAYPDVTPKAVLALVSGVHPAEQYGWPAAAVNSPIGIVCLAGGGFDALPHIVNDFLATFRSLTH